MKTGCVALVMCLNIGVDPPDVIKISPCATIECWIDPFSMFPPKALETIAQNLTIQYERWLPRVITFFPSPFILAFFSLLPSSFVFYHFYQARYKVQLDPTKDDVRKLCLSCRKNAKTQRVLFHYNGHGVPKPTPNGEIWVFNKVTFSSLSFFLRCPPSSCLLSEPPIPLVSAEFYAVHSLASHRARFLVEDALYLRF